MSAIGSGEGVQSHQKDDNEYFKPLWRFVTKLPKLNNKGGGNVLFKCNMCENTYTGSYSRVKAHLLKIRGKGIRPCTVVTAKEINEMEKLILEAQEKARRSLPKEVSATTNGSGSGSGSNKMVLEVYEPRKRKAPSGSPLDKALQVTKRDELEEEIARMFYSGGLPFNLAKNPHYIKAFKLATEYNFDGFVPPGYDMLRTDLLQKERATVDNSLKPIRETWKSKGVTLVSDGWTDSQRRPLLNFIAISENEPMFLKSVNCEAQYKDKSFISGSIAGAIDDVGPQNVIQVITDNAPVCKEAGLLVEALYPHVFWTPCVVHTLNLALKNICAAKNTEANEVTYHECHWITEIEGEASLIKNFIYNHSMRLAIFNRFVKLKLLAIAETRFASVITMLRRFKRVKNALQSLVESDEWNVYKEDDQCKASIVKEKILDDCWWIKVDYIIAFTDPIYEMLRFLDTNKSSLHLVHEMWSSMISEVRKVIYHHEKKQETDESSFWNVVDHVLHERWTKSSAPLHCLAHSLNPRYYSPEWVNSGVHCIEPYKDKDISAERIKCIKRYFPDQDERREVNVEYANFSLLADQFGEIDSIRDRMILDPKMWWVVHGSSAPKVQALALKLLSQPCSSSCCERNWSTYAFIHSLKKNKLAPQLAEDLVFVHQNLRLLSRRTPEYQEGDSKMWDVGGDSFGSLDDLGALEIADLSLDEPDLEAVIFENDFIDDLNL